MKEYQYFRVELEGHIATITISRPKALNALSWDLVTELETVIDDVSAMEDVWVVIFTGDGDKAFVAGGDIKEMYVMNPEKGVAYSKLGTRVLVMDHGQIQQYASPEEILHQPATDFVRRLVDKEKRQQALR